MAKRGVEVWVTATTQSAEFVLVSKIKPRLYTDVWSDGKVYRAGVKTALWTFCKKNFAPFLPAQLRKLKFSDGPQLVRFDSFMVRQPKNSTPKRRKP